MLETWKKSSEIKVKNFIPGGSRISVFHLCPQKWKTSTILALEREGRCSDICGKLNFLFTLAYLNFTFFVLFQRKGEVQLVFWMAEKLMFS